MRDGEGCGLVLVSDAGVVHAVAVTAAAQDVPLDAPSGARYIRAELVDASGEVSALTNPVWSDEL